jgi:hypothetical protein
VFLAVPFKVSGRELMLRFSMNRYWTLILALCLATASLFATSRLAHADDSSGSEMPGVGDPNATGDPDTPDGPGKSTIGAHRGAQQRSGSYDTGMRSVGDGTISGRAMVWKLRVAMLGLRKFYLRF